jgi:putative DNA primase/helicase
MSATPNKELLSTLEAARDAYAEACCSGDKVQANTKIAEVTLKLQPDWPGAVTLPKLSLKPELADGVLEKLAPFKTAGPTSRMYGPILYKSGCEVFALDETMRAIDEHGTKLELFNYGGVLVQILPGLLGAEIGALNTDAFAARLGQRIVFGKQVEGSDVKQTACPRPLCNAIFNNSARLKNITLRRIAHTPLYKNGVLHAGTGFDAGEHLWLDAPEVALPAVCDRPAAEAAVAYLNTWLEEFPFAQPVDQAVALVGFLSAAMRASGLRCPGFLFTKPSHGAGASTLADLMHIVLTGRPAPVINASKSAAEIDKEIDAAQGHARAALALDNVPAGGVFNTIALAQVIQQDFRAARILGESRAPVVECTQLVLVTGVNVRLADDLGRRFVACCLDPKMERPETKSFKRPRLLEEAQDRGKILQACYTIIAEFERSGAKTPTKMISGFEPWCALIAAAVKRLTGLDVAESQEAIKASDPATEDLNTLARVWLKLFGERSITLVELVNGRHAYGEGKETEQQTAAREELAELLDRIAEDKRGNVSAKTLSYKLRSWKGRVVGGRQLDTVSTAHNNTARWSLARVEGRSESDAPSKTVQPPAPVTAAPQPEPNPTSEPAPAPEPAKPNGKSNGAEAPPDPDRLREMFIEQLREPEDSEKVLRIVADNLVKLGYSTLKQVADASLSELAECLGGTRAKIIQTRALKSTRRERGSMSALARVEIQVSTVGIRSSEGHDQTTGGTPHGPTQ